MARFAAIGLLTIQAIGPRAFRPEPAGGWFMRQHPPGIAIIVQAQAQPLLDRRQAGRHDPVIGRQPFVDIGPGLVLEHDRDRLDHQAIVDHQPDRVVLADVVAIETDHIGDLAALDPAFHVFSKHQPRQVLLGIAGQRVIDRNQDSRQAGRPFQLADESKHLTAAGRVGGPGIAVAHFHARPALVAVGHPQPLQLADRDGCFDPVAIEPHQASERGAGADLRTQVDFAAQYMGIERRFDGRSIKIDLRLRDIGACRLHLRLCSPQLRLTQHKRPPFGRQLAVEGLEVGARGLLLTALDLELGNRLLECSTALLQRKLVIGAVKANQQIA